MIFKKWISPLEPAAPIINNKNYCDKMKKSLVDKIFFVDKIDAEIFVDFGCADGDLIDFLHGIFPENDYIGYDYSEKMISKARLKNTVPFFTSDWLELETKLFTNKKKALILSSVIHEVYSYSNQNDVELFWQRVWNSNFDYVVIRDMMPTKAVVRASDPLMVTRIRQVFSEKKILEWESQWGDLNGQWSLLHFLLTYQYEENWERELKENYFPIYVENLLSLVPNKYMPIYIDHYTLPWIKQCVRKDFGFDVQDPTHLKLILELTSF